MANYEFNSWAYKELIYGVRPDLRNSFNLGIFNPTLNELGEALTELSKRGLTDIKPHDLAEYVKQRLSFLVCARLISSPDFIRASRWDFNALREIVAPLLGHFVHRQLRNFGRYPDFYFYFDQQKALQVWNYWNHQGLLTVFNGTIPKGEMGPNPAHPDLKYSIYSGSLRTADGDYYIDKGMELEVDIARRLGDLKFSFMRDGTGKRS